MISGTTIRIAKKLEKEYPWDTALRRIITWIYSEWRSIDGRLNEDKHPKKNKGKAPHPLFKVPLENAKMVFREVFTSNIDHTNFRANMQLNKTATTMMTREMMTMKITWK